MATPGTARSGWLFGPGPDLLLGCGGLYIAIFALLVLAGDQMLALIPLGLLPLLTLFTGTPHVGATLLHMAGMKPELYGYHGRRLEFLERA